MGLGQRLAQGKAGVTADPGDNGLDKVTPRRAFVIGLAQCFSLWPGASRSMSCWQSRESACALMHAHCKKEKDEPQLILLFRSSSR